jgi:hypothetical protein
VVVVEVVEVVELVEVVAAVADGRVVVVVVVDVTETVGATLVEVESGAGVGFAGMTPGPSISTTVPPGVGSVTASTERAKAATNEPLPRSTAIAASRMCVEACCGRRGSRVTIGPFAKRRGR